MKKNEEPYVGMPIYLDDCDCDDLLGDLTGGGQDSCLNRCCFDDWPIAMTYTPMQQWESTYDPEKALKAGTIFPSLDLWFMGGGTR